MPSDSLKGDIVTHSASKSVFGRPRFVTTMATWGRVKFVIRLQSSVMTSATSEIVKKLISQKRKMILWPLNYKYLSSKHDKESQNCFYRLSLSHPPRPGCPFNQNHFNCFESMISSMYV